MTMHLARFILTRICGLNPLTYYELVENICKHQHHLSAVQYIFIRIFFSSHSALNVCTNDVFFMLFQLYALVICVKI